MHKVSGDSELMLTIQSEDEISESYLKKREERKGCRYN